MLHVAHVTYGIELYGEAKQVYLKPLSVAMNKCLRCLQYANKFTNVKSLYTKYNTLQIMHLYNCSIACLCHKCIYVPNSVPNIIKTKLIQDSTKHPYNTRSVNNKICYRKSTTIDSLSFLWSTIWNNVPNNLKILKSQSLFTTNYKNWLQITN